MKKAGLESRIFTGWEMESSSNIHNWLVKRLSENILEKILKEQKLPDLQKIESHDHECTARTR